MATLQRTGLWLAVVRLLSDWDSCALICVCLPANTYECDCVDDDACLAFRNSTPRLGTLFVLITGVTQTKTCTSTGEEFLFGCSTAAPVALSRNCQSKRGLVLGWLCVWVPRGAPVSWKVIFGHLKKSGLASPAKPNTYAGSSRICDLL